MNRILALLLLITVASCNKDDSYIEEFTGNEVSYSLFSASDIGSAGMVTFKERTDGGVDIVVALDQQFSNGSFPVHLHYGDLSIEDAPQATLLSDYSGGDNMSETTIFTLADESDFDFARAQDFDGSIKIHLASNGPDYDVLIAAGNIGSNQDKGFNLMGIANCGDKFEF